MKQEKELTLFIITLIYLILLQGCGVMGNPKEKTKELGITESVSDSESTSAIAPDSILKKEPFIATQLSFVDTQSEFITALGNRYQIFENNNTLQLFLNLIQEQKHLLIQEEQIKIEILLQALEDTPINFQTDNLLFYPFISEKSYTIHPTHSEQNSTLFSINFNLEEDEDSYTLIFYPLSKEIDNIHIKKEPQEITILNKI